VIAVLDRGGEDGRLVIDGRNGRIIRFVPASHGGQAFDHMSFGRGPPWRRRPALRARCRRQPHQRGGAAGHLRPRSVASRTAVPNPGTAARGRRRKAARSAGPAIGGQRGKPGRRTAADQRPTVGEAKPSAPAAKPSQEMPPVQDLE